MICFALTTAIHMSFTMAKTLQCGLINIYRGNLKWNCCKQKAFPKILGKAFVITRSSF